MVAAMCFLPGPCPHPALDADGSVGSVRAVAHGGCDDRQQIGHLQELPLARATGSSWEQIGAAVDLDILCIYRYVYIDMYIYIYILLLLDGRDLDSIYI